MSSLLSFCRQCCSRTVTRASPLSHRQFATTQVLSAKRQKQSKIRIPSKKAAAAKARRKAAIATKAVDRSEFLTLADAISVLRAVEVARPNSTLDLYVKTEIKNGVAVPKGRVNLPREAKAMSEDKILVFAEGRQAEEAKKAGAHFVGGPELIDGVINNRFKATTILCTPDLIKAITPRLGRVLGPLGLMPSERRGTVTDDIAGYIQRIRGTSEWRADKTGNIHMPIALMNFPVEDAVKNIRHFMASVKRVTGNTKEAEDSRKLKNSGAKPVTNILKVMLSSRQGPGIRILDY
ncbi:putative ribosomal protein [Lyophyllum shimeji]|uniref:Ribosomal protein n=1 Tax=Lyophyllum shimeji TaxID=47721 RepID=A0A9P3PHZ3_LYOSH|nr:putative ribosomal protein [Lyophyllum shimeji]